MVENREEKLSRCEEYVVESEKKITFPNNIPKTLYIRNWNNNSIIKLWLFILLRNCFVFRFFYTSFFHFLSLKNICHRLSLALSLSNQTNCIFANIWLKPFRVSSFRNVYGVYLWRSFFLLYKGFIKLA